MSVKHVNLSQALARSVFMKDPITLVDMLIERLGFQGLWSQAIPTSYLLQFYQKCFSDWFIWRILG